MATFGRRLISCLVPFLKRFRTVTYASCQTGTTLSLLQAVRRLQFSGLTVKQTVKPSGKGKRLGPSPRREKAGFFASLLRELRPFRIRHGPCFKGHASP